MAITISGATGALLNRFGHFAGIIRDVVSLRGGTATTNVASGANLTTRGTTLETDAAASPALSSTIDGHWAAIDSLRSGLSGGISSLRSIAEAIWIAQVVLDTPLLTKDITSALKEVRRQMVAGSTSINGSTTSIGAQTALGSPTGTPSIVTSLKREDGLTFQTAFAEAIRFTVTADSYTGGATERQETLTYQGAAAVSDPFSHLYPAGSGCNGTLTLVDAQVDASSGQTSGNLLYNSDFETLASGSSHNFANWVYAVGTAGTQINAHGSGYTGSNGINFTGDGGGTLSSIYQPFGATVSTTAGSGGTPAELEPATQYAFNGWIKAITSAPAAGVLRVALTDGSGTIINDDAGTANSFTVDLTAISTSFAATLFRGAFRTPTVMPTTVRLRLDLTTAITNTKVVVMDDLSLTPMTQLYTGGPFAAAFAGATSVRLNDAWTSTVSNTRGVMADYLERFFQLAAKDVIIPYDDGGGETASDSLVA